MKRFLLVALIATVGCTHRPVSQQFSERRCVPGTATLDCKPRSDNKPGVCWRRVLQADPPPPDTFVTCVVIDPLTHRISTTMPLVPPGIDPFDPDQEKELADKPQHPRHAWWKFWERNQREKDD